ncbi:Protein of unknown function [Bacillus cereus]|nr:Protein of unknown function [Bacillus cereus]
MQSQCIEKKYMMGKNN